jgi:hypothetical protein
MDVTLWPIEKVKAPTSAKGGKTSVMHLETCSSDFAQR